MDSVRLTLVQATIPEVRRALRVCKHAYKIRMRTCEPQTEIYGCAWVSIARRGAPERALIGFTDNEIIVDIVESNYSTIRVVFEFADPRSMPDMLRFLQAQL